MAEGFAQLKASIVRILTTDGKITGAGFLISERHLLTCAHVVAQALGISEETKDVPPGDVVLDFPLTRPGERQTARVARWLPVRHTKSALSEEDEDIAILELSSAPPAGTVAPRLVAAGSVWNHAFRAFGFPAGHDNGVYAEGVLRDQVAGGWIQIDGRGHTGFFVAPGFSGTPVWNETLGAVVGVVVGAERHAEVRAAYLIPTAMIARAWPELPTSDPRPGLLPGAQRARLFISYKRNEEPDEPIALQLMRTLEAEHDVFIDQKMPGGTEWAKRIESEIRESDYLIVLLSGQSIQSEMVRKEIEIARDEAQSRNGWPRILPVRLAYREPFPYPLSAYLDPLQWISVQGISEIDHLLVEVRRAIAGKDLLLASMASKQTVIAAPPPQKVAPTPSGLCPLPMKPLTGAVKLDSQFYIDRREDEKALTAIRDQGVTITIKAARQMGKSSLLFRTIDAAKKEGKRTLYLDFQVHFDRSSLESANLFFRQFCNFLSSRLGMKRRLDDFSDGVTGATACTDYLAGYLLPEFDVNQKFQDRLVLAMDKVEHVLGAEFGSDFFSMLRGWHDSRASEDIWSQIDLVLVTSTEPELFIPEGIRSPFNVGETVALTDFTPDEVEELNRRYGSRLSATELETLIKWLGGHPYLVQRQLYRVATEQTSSARQFDRATEDDGPFGDHLRYYFLLLHRREELIRGLLQSIRANRCDDEMTIIRLSGAGLVKREGRVVTPRCGLYAKYFSERLRA